MEGAEVIDELESQLRALLLNGEQDTIIADILRDRIADYDDDKTRNTGAKTILHG